MASFIIISSIGAAGGLFKNLPTPIVARSFQYFNDVPSIALIVAKTKFCEMQSEKESSVASPKAKTTVKVRRRERKKNSYIFGMTVALPAARDDEKGKRFVFNSARVNFGRGARVCVCNLTLHETENESECRRETELVSVGRARARRIFDWDPTRASRLNFSQSARKLRRAYQKIALVIVTCRAITRVNIAALVNDPPRFIDTSSRLTTLCCRMAIRAINKALFRK